MKRLSPLKAIRMRCLDRCAGQRRRVARCENADCPLYPFLTGKNPARAGIGPRLSSNVGRPDNVGKRAIPRKHEPPEHENAR